MHVRAVGVNTTGHAAQSQKMQREECDIEADEEEPEMPLSQCRVSHRSRHLRKPEIDTSEHRKKSAAKQHIVKVRDKTRGIGDVQIYEQGVQHESRQSTEEKNEEKAKA